MHAPTRVQRSIGACIYVLRQTSFPTIRYPRRMYREFIPDRFDRVIRVVGRV